MFELLKNCHLCPRNCNVDRFTTTGYCEATAQVKVYSYFPHKGEEPPISGTKGSGTVFFSHCPLQCVYCQNYKFSHQGKGKLKDVEQLSDMFMELQDHGCHNINLVTGTQFLPWIREAIQISKRKGLTIPIVWNSSGYENWEVVELMKNYIDIYLVDFRYLTKESALKYSCAPNYPYYAQEAITEMYRQKSTLDIDSDGILKSGVIIRVLALPGHLQEFKNIILKIPEIVDIANTGISVMTQYKPVHKSSDFPEINRPLSQGEINEILDFVSHQDIPHGWVQEKRGLNKYTGENFKEKG